jgi:serine/threonine protein kinase
MAPERLKQEAVTFNADVWSFGVAVAAAALAACPAEQAHSEFEQVQAAERVRDTVLQSQQLSPALRSFLADCLVCSPAQRSSIQELLQHSFLQCREGWREHCSTVLPTIEKHRFRTWMPEAEVRVTTVRFNRWQTVCKHLHSDVAVSSMY